MNETPPTHEEIAQLAQSIYEQEGRPEGRAEEHWQQAEQMLSNRQGARATTPPIEASGEDFR